MVTHLEIISALCAYFYLFYFFLCFIFHFIYVFVVYFISFWFFNFYIFSLIFYFGNTFATLKRTPWIIVRCNIVLVADKFAIYLRYTRQIPVQRTIFLCMRAVHNDESEGWVGAESPVWFRPPYLDSEHTLLHITSVLWRYSVLNLFIYLIFSHSSVWNLAGELNYAVPRLVLSPSSVTLCHFNRWYRVVHRVNTVYKGRPMSDVYAASIERNYVSSSQPCYNNSRMLDTINIDVLNVRVSTQN